MIVHWRRRKVFLEKIKVKKIFEDVAPGKLDQFNSYREGTERGATYSVYINGKLSGVGFDIFVINGEPKIFVPKKYLIESIKEEK